MNLAIGIVLSRLLGPERFGLLAMVTVITGFASVFADMGFSRALIHKSDVSSSDTSTVFWINVIMGAALCLIVMSFAPFVAAFYDEPILFYLIFPVALNLALTSCNIVQKALFEKGLEFKKLFVISTISTVVAGAVAIALALAGYGVWSLVVQMLVRTFADTVLCWVISPWRPSCVFDKQSFREVSRFGFPLLGSQSLNYWVRNLDKLVVGKAFGDAALGSYSKPYTIMLLPLDNITKIVSKVLFPSLSRIKGDSARVKLAYLRAIGMVTLLTYPVSVGAFVVAEPLILGLFGQEWRESVPILQAYALVPIFTSIVPLNDAIYQSQGQTWLAFKWGLIFRFVSVGAVFAGLPFGVLGIAVSCSAITALLAIPKLWVLGKVIPINLYEQGKACLPPLLVAGAMGIVVFLFLRFVALQWSDIARLGSGVIVGAFVYVTIAMWFRLEAVGDFLDLLIGRKHLSRT